MNIKPIILASGSPRRSQLLKALDIQIEVIVPDVEEIIPDNLPTQEVAEYLAELKAQHLKKQISTDQTILAADTVVILNGNLFGKPKDREEAITFIKLFSNTFHQVITGVCLLNSDKKRCFSVQSEVFMHALNDQEINYYLDNCTYMDKAGAYGIQDWIGMSKIYKIEGSYTNIMGLPTAEVYRELIKFQKA